VPLKAHFLNVGQGDCTIIEFPSGRIAMVDIDNLNVLDDDTRAEILQEYRESVAFLLAELTGQDVERLENEFVRAKERELTDPLAYYDAHVGATTDIFRFLVTHPDMDHMTGLHRLHEQDGRKSIVNFWHIGPYDFNLADCTSEDWGGFRYDSRDWETYKELRASAVSPVSLEMRQGAQGHYWTEDGVELWAPTPQLVKLAVDRDDPNIISMVLKITYKGKSIVLGGDATGEESWPAIMPVVTGDVLVLKASHHGRKTGYYGPAVKQMAPWLTITSVGEKEHDATEGYRQYSEYTVSLRKAGDIRVTIEDDGRAYYDPDLSQFWKPRKALLSVGGRR
jgi:beta-lactamase superfamily II metal-dependent hydrolase